MHMERHIGFYLALKAVGATLLLAASLSANAVDSKPLTQTQYAEYLHLRSTVAEAINSGQWYQANVQAMDLLETSFRIPNAYEHMGALNLLLLTQRHQRLHAASIQAIDQVLAKVTASSRGPVADQMEILIREGLISARLAEDNEALQRYQRLMLKYAGVLPTQWQWGVEQNYLSDRTSQIGVPFAAGAWVLIKINPAPEASQNTYYHYVYVAADGVAADVQIGIRHDSALHGLNEENIRARATASFVSLYDDPVDGGENLPELPFPGVIQAKQITRTPSQVDSGLLHYRWTAIRGDWVLRLSSTFAPEHASQISTQLPTLWAAMQWPLSPAPDRNMPP